MSNTNRECYTCSTKYYYCPSCPSNIKKESFYNMFCCERCSKIFKLLTDETFKRITPLQCKEELINLNVQLNESFKDSIKKHIEKIIGHEEYQITKSENTEENIVEVNQDDSAISFKDIENVEEQVIEELVKENEIKKMKYTPKRSRKSRNSEVDLRMSE